MLNPNITTTYKNDLKRSLKGLEILRSTLGIFRNLSIKSIEESPNETLIWLDRYSGIDWVGKNIENQVFSIAARTQFDGKAWNTFTIRKSRPNGAKTEYEKRVEAIEKGYFYPTFTLQAYINEATNEILSCGIISTAKLYAFISENRMRITEKTNSQDGVGFVAVKWADLKGLMHFEYVDHFN